MAKAARQPLILCKIFIDKNLYQEHYIIDRKDVKIAVQIPVDVFDRIVSDSEELEDIKNYRKAKKQKNDPLSLKKVFEEIDKK